MNLGNWLLLHAKQNKPSSMKIQEKEAGVSQHLPFACLEEHGIIRTHQGDYLVVLEIEGIHTTLLEDHEINFQQTLRSNLFSTFSDQRFSIYHTIIRSPFLDWPTENPTNFLAQKLERAYRDSFNAEKTSFTNRLYLTILLKNNTNSRGLLATQFQNWFKRLSHQINKQRAEQLNQEAVKLLNETVSYFTSALQSYRIRRLDLVETQQGLLAEPLSFFGNILNNDNSIFLARTANINNYLPKRHLFFGKQAIEARGNVEHEHWFATMLSLKEYPSNTYPGLLDTILELPINMVITQSFLFQNSQNAREAIELQLRRLQQARDPDQAGIRLLQQALGNLVAGTFGFGYHHLTIMVRAKTLEQLETDIAEINKRCNEIGIVIIREQLNTEASFWAQFPGNFRYIVRKIPITTANFAAFCSLHHNPLGEKSGNFWGEAVTVLKTPQHQPYYFNFHPKHSSVGHTLIMGPSGSGKTLLACFLIAHTLKYKARVFYFDKDRGAEAFMRGIGAHYAVLGHHDKTGFNPLQLPDTPDNRQFLVHWLQSLLTAFEVELTNTDIHTVQEAVRLNYEHLEPHQRTLKNLAEAFGLKGPGTLRERIDQWHSEGTYATFFDHEKDELNLTDAYFCFDMGLILSPAYTKALPALLLYIFHRIQLSLEEQSSHAPTVICLDEAWALLDHPIFAAHIKNWLKTFRKRNAVVILLSQETSDVSQSSIHHTLIAETSTKIFFSDANPVRSIYRECFHLTEREIDFLKAYSATPEYSFLIKQPQESTFAQLPLHNMQEWIALLSSNSKTLPYLHKLLKEKGSNPQQWLDAYLQIGT